MLLGKSWVKLEGVRLGSLPPHIAKMVFRVLRDRRCTSCQAAWDHSATIRWVTSKPLAWRCEYCGPPLSDPEDPVERAFFLGGVAER